MGAHSLYHTLAFQAPAVTSPSGHGPENMFHRLAGGLTKLRQRHADAAQLRNADERDLRDIGINRGDIERLFDPAFAQEYAQRGQPSVTPRRNAGG
ncbi:MAG: DUF1127 domain-containing protein [Acetobacteraceae bacterium]